ncbi:MAG TPA: hypothetical protein VIM96_08690 [Pseudomonadales bacterium]
MRIRILVIILLSSGYVLADEKAIPSHEGLDYVATQWIGKGYENNDPCNSLSRKDGLEIKAPEHFELSPLEAVQIASHNNEFACTHKWGATVWADQTNYYLVRLSFDTAIIINGKSGALSKGSAP